MAGLCFLCGKDRAIWAPTACGHRIACSTCRGRILQLLCPICGTRSRHWVLSPWGPQAQFPLPRGQGHPQQAHLPWGLRLPGVQGQGYPHAHPPRGPQVQLPSLQGQGQVSPHSRPPWGPQVQLPPLGAQWQVLPDAHPPQAHPPWGPQVHLHRPEGPPHTHTRQAHPPRQVPRPERHGSDELGGHGPDEPQVPPPGGPGV